MMPFASRICRIVVALTLYPRYRIVPAMCSYPQSGLLFASCRTLSTISGETVDATYISAKKQGASMKPSKHKMTVLSQIFKLIPRNLIPKLANEFGIDRQSRVFSPTSHVLALVFGQLTHALGLNDRTALK